MNSYDVPGQKIPVFVDVRPQENLDPALGGKRCVVGVMSNAIYGVPNLKDFKSTRTKTRKLRKARELAKYISEGNIEVDVIAVIANSRGTWLQWAIDGLNTSISKIGAKATERNGKRGIEWHGHFYGAGQALGLSMYAQMLPLIGLKVAHRAKKFEDAPKLITLCLDKLPHDSNSAVEFMSALGRISDAAQMWTDNRHLGFEYVIGVLASTEDESGHVTEASEHGMMILADWFAACCLAKYAPKQFQSESNFSDAEVMEFVAVWDAAANQKAGIANAIDIERPEYRERIEKFLRQQSAEKSSSSQ